MRPELLLYQELKHAMENMLDLFSTFQSDYRSLEIYMDEILIKDLMGVL